ncbi:SWI/SNF-related matrix-associated actin-dependent regulator of chromatin subfamily D member 1 [Hypsibius exemplaris]|uniref:SWI/SNF-related matrix-associated actin-dependent regulator of chromatin subfamily D member 1 n=1 Tax=Hypsibius exemplaris TaxID=2072580 RepID=A0A9X6RL77_HYPEX|nr:SWI/SNF-related matrix-associated actin-dependent regulator of chromatin subfamily D member 1 [Hypsibius exemplaris]
MSMPQQQPPYQANNPPSRPIFGPTPGFPAASGPFNSSSHGRNEMPPPPSVPFGPGMGSAGGGGSRAALTAALKRPAIMPNSPAQTPQLMGGGQQQQRGPLSPANTSQQQPPKKKKKLSEKSLHPGIKQIVPESQAYMDLLAFEKKLDYTISRKRIEIQEALRKPQKIKKKLRIFVSHTFMPGKLDTDGGDGSFPMWELRVEGRLLEDLNKQTPQADASRPAPEPPKSRRKFSSFFRSLVIELDRGLYGPDNHLVEWHRSATTSETDGFQVKRIGEQNVKCVIMLMLEYTPPHYKLDMRLAKLLGTTVGTKANIFNHLWIYIKRNKLQDPEHPEWINLDNPLAIIFGVNRFRMQETAQRLQSLLYPPDPIVIHHLITVDNSEGRKMACYDVDVDVDDPAKPHMTSFFQGVSQTQEIQAMDNKIFETVENINQLRINREFFTSFSEDPQKFIARWIQSQSTDLKIMTDVVGIPEAERRAEHYQGDWSKEAIHRYFFNKIQQRRTELEHLLNIK